MMVCSKGGSRSFLVRMVAKDVVCPHLLAGKVEVTLVWMSYLFPCGCYRSRFCRVQVWALVRWFYS
jgi:5-carboxymethyl-2-hydroxymuconate isomerase